MQEGEDFKYARMLTRIQYLYETIFKRLFCIYLL